MDLDHNFRIEIVVPHLWNCSQFVYKKSFNIHIYSSTGIRMFKARQKKCYFKILIIPTFYITFII